MTTYLWGHIVSTKLILSSRDFNGFSRLGRNGCKCPFVSTFWTRKAHFEESWSGKPIWFNIKRNFLEKVAFWAKAENAQAIMEL